MITRRFFLKVGAALAATAGLPLHAQEPFATIPADLADVTKDRTIFQVVIAHDTSAPLPEMVEAAHAALRREGVKLENIFGRVTGYNLTYQRFETAIYGALTGTDIAGDPA